VADVWSSHVHRPGFEAIKAAAPDTWEVLPERLSQQHTNPCWQDGSRGGRLRCLPFFQILGVSKCGTTDLYGRLVLHPQIMNCGYKVRAAPLALGTGRRLAVLPSCGRRCSPGAGAL
jgi:N-acetylgalactosamine 4-sulfate 6-O-sulfotransferase